MPAGASPFWAFSLRVYRLPGVPEACLALQDEAGADVNIVLFLLWLAAEGRAVTAADVAGIEALVGPWRRDVVVKLRAVRRDLKAREAEPEVAELRRQVKQLELEAERLQQAALYRGAASLGHPAEDRQAAAREAMRQYQTLLGSELPAAALADLLAAALR